MIFLTVLYHVVAHEPFSAVHAQVPGTFPYSIDIRAKVVNRVVASSAAALSRDSASSHYHCSRRRTDFLFCCFIQVTYDCSEVC